MLKKLSEWLRPKQKDPIPPHEPLQEYVDKVNTWVQLKESGLATEEQVIEMMREVGAAEAIQAIAPYQDYAARQQEMYSTPMPIVLGPQEEVQVIQPPVQGIEFVTCNYCTQRTPANYDCGFCGAPTPVPPSAMLPQYVRTDYSRGLTNWRV